MRPRIQQLSCYIEFDDGISTGENGFHAPSFRHRAISLFRLDYISCLLTVLSTILIGRHTWQGWIIAGANSVLICVIGLRTAQLGFIPANLFCLAIYGYNVIKWRSDEPLPDHERQGSQTL